MRRPGTRYVGEINSSSVKGRLRRFEYSTTQSYILEFGANIIRFYRHQGLISVANTDGSISNGTFTGNITGWTSRSTGGGSIAHDATNDRLSLVPGGTGATDIGWAVNPLPSAPDLRSRARSASSMGAFGSNPASDRHRLTRLASHRRQALRGRLSLRCLYSWGDDILRPVQKSRKLPHQDRPDRRCFSDRQRGRECQHASCRRRSLSNRGPHRDVSTLPRVYPTYCCNYGHTSWSLVEIAADGPYLDENTTTTTTTAGAGLG